MDPEIGFWGLDGRGGPRNHFKGHPAFWSGFGGPRGRPDPAKYMISGSRKICFHDCINTKWGSKLQ